MRERETDERNLGIVARREGEFVALSLTTLQGKHYERFFEIELFQEAGIRIGDKVELVFTADAEEGGGVIDIHMRITGLGPTEDPEEAWRELKRLVQGLDLDQVEETFGCYLPE